MGTRTGQSWDSLDTAFTPLEQMLVVRQNPEPHERESVMMCWGLVPSWAESPAIGNRLIHARAETVATKPSFREAFRARRCLIVVDSFQASARKRQLAIQMKDGRPFGIGGLWERGQDGLESCVVITTEANDLVVPINGRMPVIVALEDYDRRLDPEFYDLEELAALSSGGNGNCRRSLLTKGPSWRLTYQQNAIRAWKSPSSDAHRTHRAA
jgi:putative SOS response-associated peptidase YedK